MAHLFNVMEELLELIREFEDNGHTFLNTPEPQNPQFVLGDERNLNMNHLEQHGPANGLFYGFSPLLPEIRVDSVMENEIAAEIIGFITLPEQDDYEDVDQPEHEVYEDVDQPQFQDTSADYEIDIKEPEIENMDEEAINLILSQFPDTDEATGEPNTMSTVVIKADDFDDADLILDNDN